MANNWGIVSLWRQPTEPDMKALSDEVCFGDRLEFKRKFYAHWGLYVGQLQWFNYGVIHFGMFEGEASFVKKKISGSVFAASREPEIRADPIWKVFNDSGKVRINNIRDRIEKRLELDVIIGKARKMYQDSTPIEYDLFEFNCEHFVNLCRYGIAHSEQINPGEESILLEELRRSSICSII